MMPIDHMSGAQRNRSSWIQGRTDGRTEGRQDGRKEGRTKYKGRKMQDGRKDGRTEGREDVRKEGRKKYTTRLPAHPPAHPPNTPHLPTHLLEHDIRTMPTVAGGAWGLRPGVLVDTICERLRVFGQVKRHRAVAQFVFEGE